MARKPTASDLAAWLDAEARTDDRGAEAALAGLFAALPVHGPRGGFSDRVLRRAGIGPETDAFAARWVRWAIACALAAAAVSLLVAPAVIGPLASSLSLADILGGLTHAVVLGARWIGAGAGFWRTASDVGSAVSLAASKPPVALTLLAMVAASVGAFRALNRLISPERSASHV